MKKTVILFALALSVFIPSHATSIKPTALTELVAKADYIVVGKVVKVDMVDANGHEIVDAMARTGPRSGKTIRYHVVIDRNKTLKGNSQNVPKTLILPDWPMWIRDLRGMKEIFVGHNWIFLLRAPDFFPEPQSQFVQDISEKSEIEKILRSQRHNKNH